MHCPSSLRATLVLLSGALALASCLLIIGWRQVGRRVHHARLGLAGLIMLVLLELAALSVLHWANGAHQKPRNGCTHTRARAATVLACALHVTTGALMYTVSVW